MASRKFVFSIVALCILIVGCFGAAPFRRQRAVDTGKNTSDIFYCEKDTPCGWAVYGKYTREIEYFVKNKCQCHNPMQCVRDEEDISQYAFVYRCTEFNNGK